MKAKRNIQKQFVDVKAPLTSTKISVYVAGPDDAIGKVVKLDMTRNLRGKGMELVMKIKQIDGQLEAQPTALMLAGSYIRRIIRKGTDYVEDSFVVDCKDAKIIVKPFLLTRRKVSRSVRQSLRLATKEFITGYVTIRTSLELFSDVMSNKLQKDLSIKLKKVYPLAVCEIRTFKLVESNSN